MYLLLDVVLLPFAGFFEETPRSDLRCICGQRLLRLTGLAFWLYFRVCSRSFYGATQVCMPDLRLWESASFRLLSSQHYLAVTGTNWAKSF